MADKLLVGRRLHSRRFLMGKEWGGQVDFQSDNNGQSDIKWAPLDLDQFLQDKTCQLDKARTRVAPLESDKFQQGRVDRIQLH